MICNSFLKRAASSRYLQWLKPDQRQHTLQTTFPSLRTLMPPSTGSQSLWWTSNMNQKTLRAGISLHRSGNHPSKRQKCLIRSILHRIRPTVLWSISSKKEFGLGQVSFITHSFIGQALIFVSDRRLRRKTLKLTSPLWVLTRRGFLIMKHRRRRFQKLVVVRLTSTRTRRMLTNRELLMKMSGHETSSPHTYFQHYGWSLSGYDFLVQKQYFDTHEYLPLVLNCETIQYFFSPKHCQE